MQIPPKGYQGRHVVNLLGDYVSARDEVVRRDRPQALVLAAPTGAGKTVMATTFIENIMFGGDEAALAGLSANPNTTVLWFSDNPELNEQSRRRMIQFSDRLDASRLSVIPNTFDQRHFERGQVYFLNTQKLRSGGLLVSPGNRRTHTIWDTIENTEADRPGELLLIIDEAHRGLAQRAADANERATILARLLDGSEQHRGIRMVMGITATPARFDQYLAGSARTKRTTIVLPAEIREDGIIKDRLMLHGIDDDGEHAWTMFGQAIERLVRMDERWRAHTDTLADKSEVSPLMIVQVEDRTALEPSATPIGQLIEELRAKWPTLSEHQVAHCFAERETIEAGGWRLSHVDPSEISDQKAIRVVLFKTALNTGWDCPRAEVLMSFRSARDQTAIAQLVGRMVRTPLGMRVGGNDELNSAYLYLPHFDRGALLEIRKHLIEDDGGASFDVDVATDVRDLVLRTELRPGESRNAVFQALAGLTFDAVPAVKSRPDLHRVFALSRKLDMDSLAPGVGTWTARAAEALTGLMLRHLTDADEEEQIGLTRQVGIVSFTIEDGRIIAHDERRTDLTDSDIERAFRVTAPILSPEVASAWLRIRFDPDDPIRSKAEFLDLAAKPVVREGLEATAGTLFDEMFDTHLDAIRSLPEERRAEYLDLRRSARRVQSVFMMPPTTIRVAWPEDGTPLEDHIYVEPKDGTFMMTTSGWEVVTLREARREDGFQAFLRNYPRKSWSLSYAYEDAVGFKPGYPDFLVVRSDAAGSMIVDVLEPHRGEDSLVKARGMAAFAERHGSNYGRIHMLRFDGTNLRRLKLESPAVRTRLAQTIEQEEFTALFE